MGGWSPLVRGRRTEQDDRWRPHGRREMRDAGVAADDTPGDGDDGRQSAQRRLAREHVRRRDARGAGDLPGQRPLARVTGRDDALAPGAFGPCDRSPAIRRPAPRRLRRSRVYDGRPSDPGWYCSGTRHVETKRIRANAVTFEQAAPPFDVVLAAAPARTGRVV